MPEAPPAPPAVPPSAISAAPGPAWLPEAEARNWAMAAHLSGLVWLVGVPSFIGPLVVWLVKRNESPLVDEHGKEAVNFHLSLLVYFVASLVLALILVGFVGLVAVGLLGLICPILGAVKASNGETWRYPVTIRFVK